MWRWFARPQACGNGDDPGACAVRNTSDRELRRVRISTSSRPFFGSALVLDLCCWPRPGGKFPNPLHNVASIGCSKLDTLGGVKINNYTGDTDGRNNDMLHCQRQLTKLLKKRHSRNPGPWKETAGYRRGTLLQMHWLGGLHHRPQVSSQRCEANSRLVA